VFYQLKNVAHYCLFSLCNMMPLCFIVHARIGTMLWDICLLEFS